MIEIKVYHISIRLSYIWIRPKVKLQSIMKQNQYFQEYQISMNNQLIIGFKVKQQNYTSMETSLDHAPTAHEVLFNPMNNSTSKFQFSFSKAERFYSRSHVKSKNIKTQQSYHFYDIPSTNSKKAPSFGVGEKGSVFKVKSDTPPATTYNPTLLDDFQHYAKKANKKNKGFTFATGRQNVKNSSFIQKNSNPGPGNYNPNPQSVMDRSCSGFSMTKDERFFDSKQRAKTISDTAVVPGPGFYPIKSTIGGHNKILSQDRNINPCPRLTLPKNESRRIETEPERKIYNPNMTRTGDLTSFNRKKGFTVGKSQRSNIIKNSQIPGPGNYRIFSEFIKSGK